MTGDWKKKKPPDIQTGEEGGFMEFAGVCNCASGAMVSYINHSL